MRRYSPPYRSPPRRGYGGRGRSPPRRGHGGSGGRRGSNNGSLLVRNIPLTSRPDELRIPFERFGPVRDVYMPRDYHTREPRGFAFVEFVDPNDASEAQYRMNGQRFAGRVLTVVLAAETRKRPEEMHNRDRHRGPSGHKNRRSSYYGRSYSRSRSRSRSPRHLPDSRNRHRPRSDSPKPRRRTDYSASPQQRQSHRTRSPRDYPHGNDENYDRRSYSPNHNRGDRDHATDGYDDEKVAYDADDNRSPYRSPRRASVSPPGSRSRSAEMSPQHSR